MDVAWFCSRRCEEVTKLGKGRRTRETRETRETRGKRRTRETRGMVNN
jgi:ribosomal protein L24E